MSMALAELSALKWSAFSTRLIGIVAGWRSQRREITEVLVCIGTPSSLGQTIENRFILACWSGPTTRNPRMKIIGGLGFLAGSFDKSFPGRFVFHRLPRCLEKLKPRKRRVAGLILPH